MNSDKQHELVKHKNYNFNSCNLCRKRKIKCSREINGCINCLKKNIDCIYPKEDRYKGLKKGYIKELETKLARMYYLLLNQKTPKELRSKGIEMITSTLKICKIKQILPDPKANSILFQYNPRISIDHFILGTNRYKKYYGESSAPFLVSENLTSNKTFEDRDMEHIKVSESKIEDIDTRLTPAVLVFLLSSFFQYFHPYFPIIEIDLILIKLQNFTTVESFYCNKLPNYLLYAMLSTSWLATDSNFYLEDINLLKLTCDCYEKAKELIANSIFLSTIPNIQTLLLLSVSINTRNKFSDWIYSGMAIRMALDLGLHKEAVCKKDESLFKVYKHVWWGCYIVDRFISMVNGRPYYLSDEEFDTNVPIVELNEDSSIYLNQFSSEIVYLNCTKNNFNNFYFVKLIQICQSIGKILNSIYSTRKRDSFDSNELYETCENNDKILKDLFDNLEQQFNSYTFDQKRIYLNLFNAYFYISKILIYKPYYRKCKYSFLKKRNLLQLSEYSRNLITYINKLGNEYYKLCIMFKFYPITLSLSIFTVEFVLLRPKEDQNETVLYIIECFKHLFYSRYQLHFGTKTISSIIEVLSSYDLYISDYIKNVSLPSKLIDYILKLESNIKRRSNDESEKLKYDIGTLNIKDASFSEDHTCYSVVQNILFAKDSRFNSNLNTSILEFKKN